MVVSKTDANESTLLFVNSVSKDKKNKVRVRNSYLIPPNRDADNLQEYNNLERSEPSNPNWVRISRDAPARLPPARVLQRPVTDKSRAAPKTTPSSVDSSSNKMVQFGGPPPVPSNRASDSHMVEVVEMPAGSLPKPYLNAPDEPPTPDDSSTSFPPSDPRFRPPATGIQHYQDSEGRVHVVLAADLDASTLPSAYAAVIVETAAEATALATAAANQRHDNRRSSGRLETLVVPTSLRTRKDQDTAIVLIGDLKAAEQQAIECLREANIKKEQLEERLEEALEENCHLEKQLAVEREARGPPSTYNEKLFRENEDLLVKVKDLEGNTNRLFAMRDESDALNLQNQRLAADLAAALRHEDALRVDSEAIPPLQAQVKALTLELFNLNLTGGGESSSSEDVYLLTQEVHRLQEDLDQLAHRLEGAEEEKMATIAHNDYLAGELGRCNGSGSNSDPGSPDAETMERISFLEASLTRAASAAETANNHFLDRDNLCVELNDDNNLLRQEVTRLEAVVAASSTPDAADAEAELAVDEAEAELSCAPCDDDCETRLAACEEQKAALDEEVQRLRDLVDEMAEAGKPTAPCSDDCETKLAASEKWRKTLTEQLRATVEEIEELRRLLLLAQESAEAQASAFAAEREVRAEQMRQLQQSAQEAADAYVSEAAAERDARDEELRRVLQAAKEGADARAEDFVARLDQQQGLTAVAESATATAVAAASDLKQKLEEGRDSLLKLTHEASENSSLHEARVARLVDDNAHLTDRVEELRSELERSVQLAQMQASTLTESNRIAHVASESLDLCNQRVYDLQESSSEREALLLELTESRARLQQELQSTVAFQSTYDHGAMETTLRELSEEKRKAAENTAYIQLLTSEFELLRTEAGREIELVNHQLEEALAEVTRLGLAVDSLQRLSLETGSSPTLTPAALATSLEPRRDPPSGNQLADAHALVMKFQEELQTQQRAAAAAVAAAADAATDEQVRLLQVQDRRHAELLAAERACSAERVTAAVKAATTGLPPSRNSPRDSPRGASRDSAPTPSETLTSGSLFYGVSKEEDATIRRMVKGHELEKDVLMVLDANVDQSGGTQPYRLSVRRLDWDVDPPDRRFGGICLSFLVEGKIKFFTDAISDPRNRAQMWRQIGKGGRLSMKDRLQPAVANGVTWSNLLVAMGAQARDFSGPSGDLQPALLLAIDNIRAFTDKFDTSSLPISFLVELLLFLLDAVIAGPPTGAGEDARNAYERAEATADLPATARYLEALALGVKDPTGMKRSATADLYSDLDDVERLHRKFISLYARATRVPQHHLGSGRRPLPTPQHLPGSC